MSNQEEIPLQTGLFFDSRCLLHQCNYLHPEGPARAIKAYEDLIGKGLFQQCKFLQVEGCSVLDTIVSASSTSSSSSSSSILSSTEEPSPQQTKLTKTLYGSDIPLNPDETITPELIEEMQGSINNSNNNNSNNNIDNDNNDNNNNNNNDETITHGSNSFAIHPSFKRHITATLPLSSQFSTSITINHLHRLPRKLVDDEIISKIHHQSLIDLIEASKDLSYGEDELDSETEGDDTLYPDCKFITPDTFINRYSSISARVAVTGCVELTRSICDGDLNNAVAVIRPPGHHAGLPIGTPINLTTSPDGAILFDDNGVRINPITAEIAQGMIDRNNNNDDDDDDGDDTPLTTNLGIQGFCLYNNIAIAAQTALDEYPDLIKRVMIIDFDVHHGNGTQSIFYEKDNVLFFSIHRFSESFFPSSGWYDEYGQGDNGIGYSVNIPMESTAIRNIDFLMAFVLVVFPLLKQFQPNMIFISAGLDQLKGDPVGQMRFLTPDVIHHIIYALSRFELDSCRNIVGHNNNSPNNIPTGGDDEEERNKTIHYHNVNRLFVALEGGYNPTVVGQGICAIVEALIASVEGNDLLLPCLFDPSFLFDNDDVKSNDQDEQKTTQQQQQQQQQQESSGDDEDEDQDEGDAIDTFSNDSDGCDIYQFYITMHAAIENAYDKWPILMDNFTTKSCSSLTTSSPEPQLSSFYKIYSKIKEFETNTPLSNPQDQLRFNKVKHKVGPGWNIKVKNPDNFLEMCVSFHFLREIWYQALTTNCHQ